MRRHLIFLPVLILPVLVKASHADSLKAASFIELSLSKAANGKDSSMLLLQQALSIFQENDNLRAWIRACKNLGVAFDMAGDLNAAMQAYDRATVGKLFRQPQNPVEWKALGWLYANAGYTLSWYGKYYEAKSWYEKSRLLFEKNSEWVDALVVAYVHRELGNLYTRFGDHQGALLLLEQVKKVALQHGGQNLAAEACNDIAIAYVDTGHDSLAAHTCRDALRYPNLNEVSTGLLEGTLALALSKSGKKKEALAHTEKAKTAYEAVIRKNLHSAGKYWLANLLKLRGELLDGPVAAEAQFRQSLALLRNYYPDTLRREIAKVRLSLAHFYQQQNRLEDALREQQKALTEVLYRFGDTDPMKNPDASDFYPENTIIEALAGKAEVFAKRYSQTGDRRCIEQSLACHDLIFEAARVYREVHHFESSKLAIVEESSRRAEAALETAWKYYRNFGEAGALERAFAFAEKSKSTLLYEALRHAGAGSIANVPDSLLQQERQLKEKLAATEKALFLEKNTGDAHPEMVGKLEREIFENNETLAALNQRMERLFPAFYALESQSVTAGVAEVQALLQPGQALVEYFVGDHAIFVFLLKEDAFTVERMEKDFPLEAWVTQLRHDIEAFQFPGNDREQLCHSYTRLAQQLYKKLVQPMEKYRLPEQLLIVPGGILGYLPFDVLLYEVPAADCAFKTYPYLARRHTISYSYSSTLFKEMLDNVSPAEGLVAFAPSFGEANSSGFGPLKFNTGSAREIASLFGGRAFLKTDATAAAFRESALRASIIYLATHAKANIGEGEFSFIVLAGAFGGYDTLFVNDIYNLPLQSDLVFLGACETGRGKWHHGEGVISLARGFFYAGAKSVVTTLWSINDESNKKLTARFFRHLKAGMRKDEALRQARLEHLNGVEFDLYAHPVFWAAYAPMGNMAPLRSSGFAWWYWAAGSGLVGLFFFSLQRHWRSLRSLYSAF